MSVLVVGRKSGTRSPPGGGLPIFRLRSSRRKPSFEIPGIGALDYAARRPTTLRASHIAASGNAPGGPYLNYNQFHETFTDSDPPVLPHADSGTGAGTGSPISSTNPIPPGGWVTITPTNPSTAPCGVASLQVSFKPILAYAAVAKSISQRSRTSPARRPRRKRASWSKAADAVDQRGERPLGLAGGRRERPKTLASQVGDSIASPFRGIYNFGWDIVATASSTTSGRSPTPTRRSRTFLCVVRLYLRRHRGRQGRLPRPGGA